MSGAASSTAVADTTAFCTAPVQKAVADPRAMMRHPTAMELRDHAWLEPRGEVGLPDVAG